MSSMQEELSALKAKNMTTPPADGVHTTTPARSLTTPACTKLSPNKCVAKPSQKAKKTTPKKKREGSKSKNCDNDGAKTTNTEIAIIGDSNTRRLNNHLNKDTGMDYTVWVNAGCRMQNLENRARHMVSGSDVAVLHLGRINALSDDSDNDCLSDCSDAMDRILDYIGDIPLVVCDVTPTDNKRGQRRVNMINTLLKYKYSRNNNEQFLHSKLTLQDIGKDGIHLNDSGKQKLAMDIQNATQDFHSSKTCSHM